MWKWLSDFYSLDYFFFLNGLLINILRVCLSASPDFSRVLISMTHLCDWLAGFSEPFKMCCPQSTIIFYAKIIDLSWLYCPVAFTANGAIGMMERLNDPVQYSNLCPKIMFNLFLGMKDRVSKQKAVEGFSSHYFQGTLCYLVFKRWW